MPLSRGARDCFRFWLVLCMISGAPGADGERPFVPKCAITLSVRELSTKVHHFFPLSRDYAVGLSVPARSSEMYGS